ncbi:MAG: hypothetical protein SFT93_01485 [Rickettsiaceae bacterium]|nr:hypothetical protein [Rickettsiaceae bacterium]
MSFTCHPLEGGDPGSIILLDSRLRGNDKKGRGNDKRGSGNDSTDVIPEIAIPVIASETTRSSFTFLCKLGGLLSNYPSYILQNQHNHEYNFCTKRM